MISFYSTDHIDHKDHTDHIDHTVHIDHTDHIDHIDHTDHIDSCLFTLLRDCFILRFDSFLELWLKTWLTVFQNSYNGRVDLYLMLYPNSFYLEILFYLETAGEVWEI